MIEEAKTVLGLLHKRNFEAVYIGGKCRIQLHNEYHSTEKLIIKDIDIVTNAHPEDIIKIFPKHDIRGEQFQVVVVSFGGHEFEIATYRKDIYDNEKLKSNNKTVKPDTEIVTSLDEDRSRRDFTINAVAEDVDGNYIDYVYKYRNKTISAIDDIKHSIIRAIGNAKLRFTEDPLRILRAFRFMSQLGYEIEKQTLKIIEQNLSLIEKIPHERISGEMNKLLLGRHVAKTLLLMKEIGVFNLKIFNSIEKEEMPFLPGLNEIDNSYFNVLQNFSINDEEDSVLETWTVLLKPLGVEKAKENLEYLYPFAKTDIEKVEWLIEYYDLINSTDIRNDIFNARTGIVKRYKLMCLRDLLKRLCKIHTTLDKSYKDKATLMINNFCARPYFPEQLKVDGNVLVEIANEPPGPWITLAQEKILYKLINTQKYPKDPEKYMEIVHEAVEETLFEETMKKEGLL